MRASAHRTVLTVACVVAALSSGCTQTVTGIATRPVPGIDENSRSPVDVDTVLLDQSRVQAITGDGAGLTAIPGTDSKAPVDIDFLVDSVPAQCRWVYAETEVFGPEVEEFHKTSYQSPARGALISQAAAGYLDAGAAQQALTEFAARVEDCEQSPAGSALVGRSMRAADALTTRPGACGRDYRVKSAVLVEVTFCAFPDAVPDIVMTNILAAVPG